MEPAIEAVFELYAVRAAQEQELWAKARRGEISVTRDDMLLAVGPATGALLNQLIKSEGAKHILEIGTSYGYSTVWLAEAARETGGRVTTLDIAPAKQAYADDMITKAGLADFVEFRSGDATQLIPEIAEGVDFVLLDLWKDLYVPCLELFLPKLKAGAMVAADNMIQPADSRPEAEAYRAAVRSKPDVSTILLRVGSGVELSRFGKVV